VVIQIQTEQIALPDSNIETPDRNRPEICFFIRNNIDDETTLIYVLYTIIQNLYLNVKCSGELVTALCSHGFIFRVMKRVQR